MTDLNYGIHFVPKSQVLELKDSRAWVSDFHIKESGLKGIGEGKYFDNGNGTVQNSVIAVEPIKLEPSYHPLNVLNESTEDTLTRYLESRFEASEVKRVTEMYYLSGTNKPWENSTVFWQIDSDGNIRGGKIMHYGIDGKRTKKPHPRISWMHKVLNLDGFNLKQCLFGLHLVSEYPNKEIAVVESEKTALIMSIVEPDKVWLATGSKSGLKPSMLAPLKKRKITAHPDKGCFEEWNNKASTMNDNGFNIEVSDILENSDLPDGSDLADLITIKTN